MKLVIGGVAQGKLDYVLENMIEKTEKYDVYDCFFLKDNACNDKASNMEWPWDFAVDDERILIIDKFHYFIRAVLEKNLPLQEYILKFMQFAEENKDTIVIADAILSNLMSKYKLVRKNPSREYFIADYNIGVIREHIDGIMTRKGSGVIFGVVQDRNGVIIPENDLDSYIYDIILILLIRTIF